MNEKLDPSVPYPGQSQPFLQPQPQPQPQLQPQPQSNKARRIVQGLLLGAVVGLFAVSQWTSIDLNPFKPIHQDSPSDLSEITDLQGPADLSHFMESLQDSFGGCHGELYAPDYEDEYGRLHSIDSLDDCSGKNSILEHCKQNIAFPPRELQNLGRPPRRHEHFCKPEDLHSQFNVFSFSPDTFKHASVILEGHFSRGGHVVIEKSTSSHVEDVQINVTLYAGRKHLFDQVSLTGFDNEGNYTVEIKRAKDSKRRESSHKPPVKADCLIFKISVVLPTHLDKYDSLSLHLRSASRVSGKGLDGIEFDTFRAGVGQGAIIFDGLKAKHAQLGVLYGVVMGTYQPSERFEAGTIRGATQLTVEPQADNTNITVASVFGRAVADIPSDYYQGNFLTYSWSTPPTIEAAHPEDLHVTEYKYTLKKGYFKKQDTESNVVVHNKHGLTKLHFT
ncbi:hypothetical protein J3Q64DRAFT_1844295 [Phycomyces blakesleeanus]|uniref:Uncharacterized protein n=2 Tax=Phycomyces blakesleeanus TaxID=4837 RepID=A0A167K4X1_PHYB8|nr:hypothetical protein PHYBLDRAFT_77484 [Phycomyces blakesleeanus NRRL 1555(-)]OAD67290.1 hypothetical protein PHYBLDRAFT_77484 [Phycomyces blakesleeanus NRRL 1555(-)]|eukprot:XP_018285330.1 hypothetical protein PHYBLDRAFT_77484 [Phycomyces blakesleeanus NRRL 1555(-)]